MTKANRRKLTTAELSEVYAEHRGTVRSFLLSACHKANVPVYNADDLSQEIYVRLLNYGLPDTVENMLAYLNTIAINLVNELQVRACMRHPHLSIEQSFTEQLDRHPQLTNEQAFTRSELYSAFIDTIGNPGDIIEREDAQRALRADVEHAVNKLAPRQRKILLMHASGLTYKEIAQQLGITYRIVLRDLVSAYATLRRFLSAHVQHVTVAPKRPDTANGEDPRSAPKKMRERIKRGLQLRAQIDNALSAGASLRRAWRSK